MDREERDKAVYLAKLAEQAERYDGAFLTPYSPSPLLARQFVGLRSSVVRSSSAHIPSASGMSKHEGLPCVFCLALRFVPIAIHAWFRALAISFVFNTF